ncbi:LOG family protein [Leptothoe sp. ISB3NOV94-8A]|nr:LOG family protein [Leptothoe sp. LEGE 181152]
MADSDHFRGLSTAIETDSKAVFEVVEQSILGLWEVVNNLTALRPPKRARYRVTIFGSARMAPGSELYQEVKQLASELTLLGCDIVTGGGPGLMQAANEGSVLADPNDQVKSIGIRVDLKHEQATNPFVEEAYCHRTFFSRLHHFVLMSDAFVVMPGGIGTTLEALMIWQLLQVRKLDQTPFILVGSMWKGLLDWTQTSMLDEQTPMIDPADMAIPRCVERYEDAIAILRASQQRWQQAHPAA